MTAVDQSSAMIEIAREDYGKKKGLTFIEGNMCEVSAPSPNGLFDAVVANMSLCGIVELTLPLSGFHKSMRSGGKLVLTDVHPWFWRQYKGHFELPYWQTVTLFEPLTISLDSEPLPAPTPVVYRPLYEITGALARTGFVIENIDEPRPNAELEAKYPEMWLFPRFIVITAHKA